MLLVALQPARVVPLLHPLVLQRQTANAGEWQASATWVMSWVMGAGLSLKPIDRYTLSPGFNPVSLQQVRHVYLALLTWDLQAARQSLP